jgi:hypothetical protein
MKNAKEAMLCWNPDSADVTIVQWPDTHQLSDKYQRTSLACFSGFSKSRFEQRKTQIFIDAMHLIIRDGCDPMAVHKALLVLPEYQDGLAEDMPRARQT